MLRNIYLIIAIIFQLFISQSINAEKREMPIRFSSLSIEDGLSQSTVYSIAQDKKGNLWIGTADGLNRYDGYSFTVYRHNNQDSASIQSDLIRSLYVDNKQQLWIGTGLGLSLYNSERNTFRNYILNTQVNDIIQINDSSFHIGTADGLYTFNVRNEKFIQQKIKENEGVQVLTQFNNLLLVGTNQGLYMSLPENSNLVPYHKEFTGVNIMDICPDRNGLWIATEGKGLYFVSADGKIKNYVKNGNDRYSISSDYVRTLCIDKQQRLWVGTFSGLSILDETREKFDHYYSNEVEKGSINQNSVRSLYLDAQGAMWVGTFFGGLNYYHPLKNQFGRIRHIPYANSLNDNVVSSILESRNGELWIGTNDNGLNFYDQNNNSFKYYTANKANSLLSNNVKGMLIDGNYIYIGTHGGGFSRLDRNSSSITNFTARNSNVGSDNVYSFSKDRKGNIWIGTLNGLTIYNPVSNSFEPFKTLNPSAEKDYLSDISKRHIYTLLLDSKEQMWIGSETGVYIYTFSGNTLRYYNINTLNTSSDDKVNCIFEDNKNRIWIGTRSGLHLFNPTTQSFKSYTTEQGLPNNNVLGILQDSFGRLWLSTNKGLVCFTPENEKVRIYTLVDGIQSDQFNNYSYCKTSSGEMFFGGINGITHFYPENLVDNPFTPKAILTQFTLFNRIVMPGDETGILSKDISETEKVKLKPYQTSFSLVFTVPNYLSAKHNTFAYKLDGFDKDWNYTSDIRTVSYSNLDAGNYTFYVKAANSDGIWNDEPTILEIEVTPYWWQTVFARILFAIAILTIIYFIARFFYNRQSFKNQLALERLEKEKIEEVNQMKLRFFINISHEFRTPLTLIMSPLQEIYNRSTEKWTREQIKLIQRNTNKLFYLVNQLMDYRRAELGVFEVKVVEKDPTSQVEELMSMFERLAKQKHIDFVLRNNLTNKHILFDPNYLDLILSNLLSNAFKYTHQNGEINISLENTQNDFIITVSDNGDGIPKELQDKIFERFYQVNVENIGTGIGLSLIKRLVELHHGKIQLDSEPGKGSVFAIYLPQNKSLYDEKEISDNQQEIVRRPILNDEIDLMRMSEEDATENVQTDEKKPVLLIVEDDVEIKNYLADNLSDIANIEKAGNGEDALKIVKEHDIDMVVTDIMLPVMDGIKLCKAIKQNIRTSHIPVIMLTAKTNQQDQLEGLAAGADDYLNKPFSISILKMKVQNMLKARTRMQEHYSNTLEVDPEKITFNEMDKEFLEKAKKIVEENMDNMDFSVDDFCKEMGMSRSNLHLKMKAITGESTIEFIKKIRFNEACNLLKDGRYSIAEISTIVGFNTPSYFTTSFKKYFGILPTDYVKELRK